MPEVRGICLSLSLSLCVTLLSLSIKMFEFEFSLSLSLSLSLSSPPDFFCLPSKHARSDPEAFWLRPVMAVTANLQPESGRIVYAGSDFPHPFQFRLPPAQNRSGWSGQALAKRIWSGSRCAGIFGPGFWTDATGPLPVSHVKTRFRSAADVPDNIVRNQPGSDLVLADCVRFWPNGSGPEASRCARIIRPVLPSRSGPDANRIRHVYWVRSSRSKCSASTINYLPVCFVFYTST